MNALTEEPLGAKAIAVYVAGGLLVLTMFGGLAWVALMGGATVLDARLCPVEGGPTGTTVLLLDTTDPLSAKHTAELKRLVKELKGRGTDSNMAIRQGEALVAYILDPTGTLGKPSVEVCNPGNNPDEWTLSKGLTQGKVFALYNWQQFEKRIEELFPAVKGEEQLQSPILEALAIVVPRHAPSQRDSNEITKRLHLIIFSDLLQHSPGLSHYGQYPDIEGMKQRGKRELLTNLSGVDVSLFRLERDRYAKWQTVKHYYWWTHTVQKLGGRVFWQQSL